MPLVCFDCGKPIERHPERWSEDEPKRLVCEECHGPRSLTKESQKKLDALAGEWLESGEEAMNVHGKPVL